MKLETDRLQIRYIEETDWKSAKEIWEDFNKSDYAQYDRPHITEESDVKNRIKRWAEATRSKEYEHMFFAVCLEGEMIGYIAFNQREDGHEIGYSFHSKVHGKGYAKESHLAIFSYLKTLGISRFIVGTALKNTPSVKLLSSLGFTLVETEQVSFYQDEKGQDIYFEGGIFELKL